MGACCSCFRICEEPEVASPRWNRDIVLTFWDKLTGVNSNKQSEDSARHSSKGNEPIRLEAEVACADESSEDEDVCPTCLEEYDPENPRIVLRCSHSYHLGCIYEWMERSANCPICGKMMIFDEV